MPSWLKTFLAFAVYAAVHSALLTDPVRRALERALGPGRYRGWFRLGFTVQAVVLLGLYVGYVASLTDTLWFRLEGALAWLLWALRLVALGFIARCVAQFGTAGFLGWEQLQAWRRGEKLLADPVETGPLVVRGAYRWVRHPMYAAGFVVIWADPSWSANGFAFAVAASLYLWLGALHEERRLVAHYGEDYRRYQVCTPRFLPRRGPA